MNIETKTAHDKIIKAMVRLQKEHPFFSYILMNFRMTSTVSEQVPTAAVNKYGDFFYNEEFIMSLENAELRGMLVHETMHIAKGDFFRMGIRDPFIWNVASDAVINFILVHEKFTLPPEGITPTPDGKIKIGKKTYNVKGKSTEEFYEELEKDAEKIPVPSVGHGGWDIHLPDDKNADGESNGHEKEKGSKESSARAQSKWNKIIVESAAHAHARGLLPGCAQSLVDHILNPVIDWRTRVQKFITNEIPVDYTNRSPGRKFYATGVWMPKVIRENLEVFISVDVSGSTLPDRQYFINEIMGVISAYEQVKARLIFWDYNVHPENDHVINSQNKHMLNSLAIKDCNGGTRMSSYADYCKEKGYKCRLHVILTDGEIESSPEVPDGNIIFVLTAKGNDEHIKSLGAICRLTDVENA